MMPNTNSDNNLTNNNTININVAYPKKRTSKAKTDKPKSIKTNWYKKTIIAAIITFLLSIAGYWFNNSINTKNQNSNSAMPITNQVEGVKQN